MSKIVSAKCCERVGKWTYCPWCGDVLDYSSSRADFFVIVGLIVAGAIAIYVLWLKYRSNLHDVDE